MLQWKDDFCIGVEAIDEQHRRLVEIANNACALMENDLITDKYDQIIAIVDELKNYTVYHFGFEEQYMASIGYKKRFSHMILHGDFIAKIEAVNFNEVDHHQDEYINKIINFVCDWLVSHILREDKQITGRA